MSKITIEPPTIHAQALFDRLNEAVEANENLDVAQFFLNELLNEVATDLAFCCYCRTTAVKAICCDAIDGLTAVDSSNMYALAAHYELGVDDLDNLEQAVGEYEGDDN
jgi:hypothetical protein